EDLEEWERFPGITIGPGDALLVRTGYWAMREAEGPWAYEQGGAGLHASVLPWLRARGVALLASDAVNDVQPSGVAGITGRSISSPRSISGCRWSTTPTWRTRRRWRRGWGGGSSC